jgi:hypothetical protein
MLTRRLAILSIVALGSLAVLATSPSAYAERKSPGNPTPVASGNRISVTVTGTGVKGGSGGTGGRSHTVPVPVPCMLTQGMTGKAYFDYIQGGAPLGRDKDGTPYKPNPGYEQYKDDDKGHWYSGMCSSESFGDLEEFFKFSNEWFAQHRAVYVQPGQQPPIPPVPPELLRNVAFDEMAVPTPHLDWNPKHTGDAASVVNLDTWVWLRDRRNNLYVEASVNSAAGRISARVEANLTGMTVSAPNAETVECERSGVPYSRGATGECSIRFSKASPGQSRTPVTVRTNWHTTWLANTEPQGDTPKQLDPPPGNTPIRILEIHAVGR